MVVISRLAAQAPWLSEHANGSTLTIKLATVDPGDELYAWWGHSGIIVEDSATGISRLYDYGLFNFKQDRFYRNFAQGRLIFLVGTAPTGLYLDQYAADARGVRIQTLDLPPESRLEVARIVDDNSKPRQNTYLYDHYFNNCATKLRDILSATSGGLFGVALGEMSGATFREETRRYTSHSFFIDFLLMYLMGDLIDREMSIWETMFLPIRLEERIGEITYVDANGTERPVVSRSQIYNEPIDRRTIPDLAPPLHRKTIPAAFAFGLVALVAAGLGRLLPRTASWVVAFHMAATGLVSGLLGTLLFLMSLFTDHVVTYGNENLIYSNPLALAIAVSGFLMLRPTRWRERFALTVSLTFAVVVVVYATVKPAVAALGQANWPEIAFFGIIYLTDAISLVVLRTSRVRNRLVESSAG